jgi:hypothetical protein
MPRKYKKKQQGKGVIEDLTPYIYGRPSDIYPPSLRALIEQQGNSVIENVEVMRVPINHLITKVGNLATRGMLGQKMAELNIDALRHLYLVLRVNGINYLVEKNEVIQAMTSPPSREGAEVINLGPPKNQITVEQLFTQLLKEDPHINVYDAFKSNCQGFVGHILRLLGLWNSETISFVQQNVGGLVDDFTKKIARTATNIASIADVWIHGKGRNPKLK